MLRIQFGGSTILTRGQKVRGLRKSSFFANRDVGEKEAIETKESYGGKKGFCCSSVPILLEMGRDDF